MLHKHLLMKRKMRLNWEVRVDQTMISMIIDYFGDVYR